MYYCGKSLSQAKPHTRRGSCPEGLLKLRAGTACVGGACALAFALIFAAEPGWAGPLSLVVSAERTQAATDCADAAALFAKVEGIVQRPLSRKDAEADAIRVVVRFDRNGEEYQANLEFEGPKPGERNLRDRSDRCEPLQDAVAVAIALLLDDELERREREAREVARAVTTISIISGAVEPKRAEPVSIGISTEAGVQVVFDTRASPGFAVAVAVSPSPRWLFELCGLVIPPATSRFEGGEVDVSLLTGAARVCRLWGENWQWGPCAAVALGRLHGSGHGFDESLSSNLLWSAFGGELLLQRSFERRWQLGAHAGAWVPFRESRFSVQNSGTAWNSNTIWPWLALRLGVRF